MVKIKKNFGMTQNIQDFSGFFQFRKHFFLMTFHNEVNSVGVYLDLTYGSFINSFFFYFLMFPVVFKGTTLIWATLIPETEHLLTHKTKSYRAFTSFYSPISNFIVLFVCSLFFLDPSFPMAQHFHLNTPLLESVGMSKLVRTMVYLKMENSQPSGSFKIRGIGKLCQQVGTLNPVLVLIKDSSDSSFQTMTVWCVIAARQTIQRSCVLFRYHLYLSLS